MLALWAAHRCKLRMPLLNTWIYGRKQHETSILLVATWTAGTLKYNSATRMGDGQSSEGWHPTAKVQGIYLALSIFQPEKVSEFRWWKNRHADLTDWQQRITNCDLRDLEYVLLFLNYRLSNVAMTRLWSERDFDDDEPPTLSLLEALLPWASPTCSQAISRQPPASLMSLFSLK